MFLSAYIQVFFLVTFLENRKKIIRRKGSVELISYPSTTVIVPCWNEESTIDRTVSSLLDLDYPKDKLTIFIVDDGSTDNTWNVLQKYTEHFNIKIFHKENDGGKYAAVNYGLARATSEFIGCLDADSFVDKYALKRIMTYFAKDESVMAVAPAIIVDSPKNILQNAQRAEYDFGVFLKKMLGFMGAIHVLPGPFSIFRKKVFDELGPYRHAHNTEDAEIALRMQEHHYKIEHCPDAYVYTVTPNTVKKLYKQRLRWIYGFLKNATDYKHLIFNKRYGAIGIFTIPAGLLSILTVVYLFVSMVYDLGSNIFHKFVQIQTVGLNLSVQVPSFDWFFISTKSIMFITVIFYVLLILSMMISKKIIEGKARLSFDVVYFAFLSSILAPFWLTVAVYNTIVSKSVSWR